MHKPSSIVILCAALLALTACSRSDRDSKGDSAEQPGNPPPIAQSTAPAGYIGSNRCRTCHEQQWQDWYGSQHDLALQQASGNSVLADFSGTYPGMRFEQAGQHYRIAPDAGTPALAVRYTFGVEPLQQYVIESEPGRMQVLPVPWDTRPADQGGQRWYPLYPGNYPPGDPMHWNGQASNWNAMCADCHSTGVSKGYDPATHSYDTTFAEEDVACEACHGPGSSHAAAPALPSSYQALDTQAAEINSCAPCHSRRSHLAEGFTPAQSYFDFYLPSLLESGLYHPDGQILDEVYVYGSFLQSRMHLRGVSCSNCHDPHSAELKLTGNDTCTQCHNPQGRSDFPSLQAALYDDESHHHHAEGSAGAMCVNCHMPSAIYMGVDERRDHSFRIPRPDLSAELDIPNACNQCHQDRSVDWASGAVNIWFGERPPHYGSVFAAAQRGDPAAEAPLASIAGDADTPIMVRANALALLGNYNHGYTLDRVREAISLSPLLQIGATRGAAALSADSQWRLLSPLLEDQHRAVRTAAFSALLPLARDPVYAGRLRTHLPAFVESQQLTRDFPPTLVNLANAYSALGDRKLAEEYLDEALLLQPSYVPALLNLTDLYRATLRDAEAEALLQRALEAAPDSAEVAYSHALWLIRARQPAQALAALHRALELAPDNIQYGYGLALALNDSGQGAAAVARLEAMLQRSPDNETLLSTLVTMLRDQQRYGEALDYLQRLLLQHPEDQSLRQMEQMLKSVSG